jgi:hypothetical protein
VQLVKLPTRSQTRRVKLYSIKSQNQVDFCCLICFSFVTAVLEKQIRNECDLRNRALPPFVSDCNGKPPDMGHHPSHYPVFFVQKVKMQSQGRMHDENLVFAFLNGATVSHPGHIEIRRFFEVPYFKGK